MVYGSQKPEIRTHSAELQFQYRDVIIGVQHFSLSEQNCMEIIAVKGTSRRLTELSDKMITIKGIQHGKLIMSKTE